ncbi:coiled-coil protein [Legionella steigerwaltii]|uniref:Coiled-coil protein n=1 Tax=Legionella steigerwaltii TaxID=460 RepID=A0A378L4N2_9GAMM|nr:hypothetical protein [Legionella steigerwaltii]KTD71991.1 coiled-coil protein [Legionella steigerwaltii]STY21657.1 coiled-coil protein [Legionella steigerwaltii]
MGGELELYQKEINTAIQPIFARLEHYRNAMFAIRKLLKDYFFDTWRTQKLTEVAKGEEVVFSFNLVQEAMEKCLVDENTLIQTAQIISNESETPSLVAALDTHVLESGLPIELRETDGVYLFKSTKPYTPSAQAFMCQFAYALSAYRVCLGICETYFALYRHEGIQTVYLQNYIESVTFLKQQMEGEVDFVSLHKQARGTEKEIMGSLRTEKVHEGLNHFKEDIDSLTKKLVELLESGAAHLQNCYKEFPNNPILWMLHDRSWHTLLKTLSGLMYADQYTYSTLYGTLTIKKEFIELIKAEIDRFGTVALAKTPLLKIELLRKAAKLIAETKIDILAKLAEQGVELVKAPQIGMFPTPPSPDVYSLLLNSWRQSRFAGKEIGNEEKEEPYPGMNPY